MLVVLVIDKRGFWLKTGLLLVLLGMVCADPAAAQRRHKKRPAPASQPTPVRHRSTRSPKPAPSKEQLERERRQRLRQIQQTSQALDKTQQKKRVSLGQLNVIKEKLTVKKEVIQSIATQLHGIETNVQQTARQVLQTQKNLAQLKAEYARMLYTASKTASGFNRLMFLFAADSFNQFALRLRYIRQYTQERQQQAARIVGTQARLGQQLTGLTVQQRRKSSLLNSQLTENNNLLGLKTQQDQMVQQLSQQEQGLRQELAERQQAVRQLDNLIAQRVRDEIAKAARAARLAARREAAIAARGASSARPRKSSSRREAAESGNENAESNDDKPVANNDPSAAPEADAPETAAEAAADRRASRIALTPETALAATKFSGNRGHLPWPVSRGFISQRYGQHPHPVLKNVVVENRGVDIQTAAGEDVRAVFEGKVLTIVNIAGMHTIVMIQHGDFFTVYAKLRSVNVHVDQRVSLREVIGTVATDADGTSEVQFQVWHNSANLNPENWLGRK